MIALGLIAVVAAIAVASLVVVDETEFAVVTSFGTDRRGLRRRAGGDGPARQGTVAACARRSITASGSSSRRRAR